MRTTLTIDDSLFRELKEIANRSGKSFKQVVNEALQAGIQDGQIARASKPYRLEPQSMGDVKAGYDLAKTLQLANRLEDEELVRKLVLKK